jgi:hypothetical protein
MVCDERVVRTVPEDHRAPRLVDRRFIPCSAQEVHQHRESSTAARTWACDPARFEAKVRTSLTGDVGYGGDRGRVL